MSRRPYNLFLLIHQFPHGGSERQFVEVVRRLDPKRFRVSIGCLVRRGPLLERLNGRGCEIHEFPLPSLKSAQAVRQCIRLAKLLRTRRTDLVHAFDFYTNILAVPAARLARVPVVLASRRDIGDAWSPFRLLVQRQVYRWAHAIVANSEAARQSLVFEGINKNCIRVIRNGVDLRVFRANGNGAEVRRRLEYEERMLLVGIIANLRPEKNHGTLLAAVPAVIRRIPTARFLIVGTGPMEAKLKAIVNARRLTEYVRFLGDRTDVPELLSAVDVCVLPSHTNESLPNAILEAMSAGRPVVATAVGGSAELIEPGRTGFLVPPGDAESLADRIALLLEQPALREKLGSAARARTEAEFDIALSVRRFEALYTEMLEEKLRGRAW